METKRCSKCGNEHPNTSEYFHVKTNKKIRADGSVYIRQSLKAFCKECANKRFKEYYKEKPEYFKEKNKNTVVSVEQLQRYRENYDNKHSYKKWYKILYIKQCPITNQTFFANSNSKKYSDKGVKEIARRKSKESAREKRGIDRVCRYCGKSFIISDGYYAYCSDKCKYEVLKIRRKTSTIRRESIKRSRRIPSQIHEGCFQNVNPLKVFGRDKWICQMCGIKTPYKLRGTYEDNAPELDHIVPLSKGGLHTYSNTQCLCRKCNGSKSDKLINQLVLCM